MAIKTATPIEIREISEPGIASLDDEQIEILRESLLGLGYKEWFQIPSPVYQRYITKAKGE